MKNHEAIRSSAVDAESSPDYADAQISQQSSPRSVEDTGSLTDDQISLKSEDLNTARVKFLCSYGGKIYPRPCDKQLRYIMGESKIVAVGRNITYEDLMAKLAKLAGKNIVVKYQLPHEDLDALVSVVSDEDIQNMLEEYEKAEARKFSRRLLRLFLFPNKRQDEGIERFGGGSRTAEQQFLDAVNGVAEISRKPYEASAHQVPDYLFGLDTASETPSNTYTGTFQGIKGFRSPDEDFIFLQLPSCVSISACNPAENLIAQHANYALDVSSSSRLDLRDHQSSCSGPLGRVDAGRLSDTALMNPVAEAFLNSHGPDALMMPRLFYAKLAHAEESSPRFCDPKLTSQMQTQQSDAFGASLPQIQLDNYPEIQHEKNQNSKILQGGDHMDRGRNSPKSMSPIADFYEESGKIDFLNQPEELRPVDKILNFGSTFFNGREEKGDSADGAQPLYISEESSGLLYQRASSLPEHQQQQELLHSHPPVIIDHETYWRAHQQQQQDESVFGMCSICNFESAIKAMVPQHPADVVRAAILHLPSKLTTFQAAKSGDPSCSRQVCDCQPQPTQYFKQISPLATLNLQPPITSEVAPCSLPKFNATSSLEFGDQCVQREGRIAWSLQGAVKKSLHHHPVVGSNLRMLYNPHLTLAYAQRLQRSTFQYTDGKSFGFYPNDSSCNQNGICQGKEAQRIMDGRSHAIYH